MDYKNFILEAAAKLFKEHGIKSVTMDDIARDLGISKRTLYENYAKKEDLIADCLEEYIEQGKEVGLRIVEKSENIIEALLFFLKKDCTDDTRFIPATAKEIKRYYPELFQSVVLKHKEERTSQIAAFLEKGQKEGLIRKDIKPDLMSKLLTIQIDHFLNHDPETIGYSTTEMFSSIFMTFTRGISTPEGYQLIEKLIINNLNKPINKII